MFKIDLPPVAYKDPWYAPFNKRKSGLSGGKLSVAYFYETPDNSTFRYRVYNMIQALRNSNSEITASFFCNTDIEYIQEIIEIADVLVFCRTRYSEKIDQAITLAKSKGKKVFFDVDDLVFDTTYTHLILNTLDQDLNHPNVWDTWFAYISRIGATLKLCDAAITTNDYLAQQIHKFANIPVHTIPNFLNAEQLDISNQLYQNKNSSRFARTSNIHLGYFSGTPTHNKDFSILTNALVELFEKRPEVSLLVVGFMDLKGELSQYKSRILVYPLHDFVNLQRIIAHVEINLVPLQDNVFTNCKSELKYFEAAITGTITVATPTFTFVNSIKNGSNGYLSKSYEWFEKIDSVIDNMQQYPEMAETGYKHAKANYGWEYQKNLIEQVLTS
jgi:glycosyltransferase involved in cell wall biosynthesis